MLIEEFSMNHDSVESVDELPLEEGSDQVDTLPPVHTELIVLDSPNVVLRLPGMKAASTSIYLGSCDKSCDKSCDNSPVSCSHRPLSSTHSKLLLERGKSRRPLLLLLRVLLQSLLSAGRRKCFLCTPQGIC